MENNFKNNVLDVVNSCDTVQFCTLGLDKYPETRTLANIFNKDKKDLNELYFMTNIHSNKIKQILKNNNVSLYYLNLNTRKSITLFGNTEIIFDNNEKSKFWVNDMLKFGYTGKNDENYCIIKFKPISYKYYINSKEINKNI